MRFLIVFCVFWLSFGIYSQTSILMSDSLTLPDTRGYERDPLLLVNKLTENSKSEKESFDLIYTWVVKNIEYDYKTYFSTRGNKLPNIDRILRRKKGICLDYAYLMDTLCSLSGITNVTVLGYAKDDIFDVQDSIYVDNHAWNAVRLNHLWYVYDITASSGGYTFEYTRFSKLLIKWVDKLASKKVSKQKKFRSKGISECEKGKSGKKEKSVHEVTITKIPFIRNVLINILYRFKLRVRKVNFQVTNLNYYLTQPEVLAVTHFPDNPCWSLTSEIKTIQDFEQDSTYYHLDGSLYKNQVRTGRVCHECDRFLNLTKLDQHRQMKRNSHNFNPKNDFITWNCDFDISQIYFDSSLIVTDSLTKVSLLDSSIFYLDLAKKDLRASLIEIKKFAVMQNVKNKRKANLLKTENKKHEYVINSLVKVTYEKKRKLKSVENRNKSLKQNYRNTIKKLNRIDFKPISTSKPKPPEKIQEIQNNLKELIKSTDSINLLISDLSNTYIQKLNKLSKNVWLETGNNERLSRAFVIGGRLRVIYQLDNYKKIIVGQREKIKEYETIYSTYIQQNVIALADTCLSLNLTITALTKKRNDLFFKSAKLINSLISERVIPTDSLKKFILAGEEKVQNDRCWIIDHSGLLAAVNEGMKIFAKSETRILKFIRYETQCELIRYNWIKREIIRLKTKYTNVVLNNRKVTEQAKELSRKTKRAYLEKLKQERKNQAIIEKNK